MAGRSGRRRVDHEAPLVDLEVVFADDDFVDSIAATPWGAADTGRFAVGSQSRFAAHSARGPLLTTDPLADLFQTWRQDLAAVPMPAPPSVRSAIEVVDTARAPAKRPIRPMLAIAAAIVALLVGSATIGSKDAAPNSALWAITKVLWPDREVSYQSSENARGAIKEARLALQAGRTQDAQLALLKATVELGKVDDSDGRGDMQQTVANLWVAAAPPQSGTSDTVPDRQVDRSSVSTTPSSPATTAASAPDSTAAPTTPATVAPPTIVEQLAGSDLGLLASAAVVAPSVGAGPLTEPTSPVLSEPGTLSSSPTTVTDPAAAEPTVVDSTQPTDSDPTASLPATLPPPVIAEEPLPDPTTSDSPLSPTQQASAPTPSTPVSPEPGTTADTALTSSADPALPADSVDASAAN
jgi:hypothetical protein